MFKVGDKVVCIKRVDGTYHRLVEGETYSVISVGHSHCILSEMPDMTWLNDRFVLASEYSAQGQLANETKTALDIQHGGGHYKGMRIQPVEFIHANNIGYMEGNAIKYLCRWQLKNGLEDLNKAKHYIELLIQMENEREQS